MSADMFLITGQQSNRLPLLPRCPVVQPVLNIRAHPSNPRSTLATAPAVTMTRIVFALLALACAPIAFAADNPLVLQTDFGTKDGAVAAMRGVAVGVSRQIPIYDLSHENTPYDIWEGAYRLMQ